MLRSFAAFACKIHVSICCTRPVLHCRVSAKPICQDPLITELLRKIHVSGFAMTRSMDHLQDLRLQVLNKIHASGSMSPFPYVRILYKMHISEPMSQHPYLRALCKIHVVRYITRSATQDHLQDPCLRILYKYKTEVFVSMSQHPCLWAHRPASLAVGPLQDPCLRIHYKLHGSMSPDPCLRGYASAS